MSKGALVFRDPNLSSGRGEPAQSSEDPVAGSILTRLDHSTHRVYRLHDFTKAHAMEPDSYYCVSGKVNSADKLYLVIESVKPDAKHNRSSNTPVPVDDAES